jgi:site-specific recombinase XerD
LLVLRDYWREYRPDSPDGYLFPGARNIGHLSNRGIQYIFALALRNTNINKKNISPHTLRHCFATFLLEDGLGLLQIKELLGHASLSSSTVYIHLANTTNGVVSPADYLPGFMPTGLTV